MAVTRRKLTREEIDKQDFSAFLASDSESDDEESRTRLRQLLLGNLQDRDEAEAFGQDTDDEDEKGGMQITFTPGLTEKGAAEEDDEDEDNITTLEAYKRKMREKRRIKKEEREKRLADGGAASSDDEDKPKKGAKKTGKAGKDDFFAAGSSSEDELDANIVQVKSKKNKNGKAPQTEAEAKEAALLDLLTLPSSTTTAAEKALGIDQTKHFSMADIIKDEKSAGKQKRRRLPHGKKGGADREKEVELGDKNFEIDTGDSRFSKKLLDDHRFAIDPSNPQFKKTKAMGKLLDERNKARSQQTGPQELTPGSSKASSSSRDRELDSLVASAKRKAGGAGAADGEKKKRRRK